MRRRWQARIVQAGLLAAGLGAAAPARAYRTAAEDSDLPTTSPVAWEGPECGPRLACRGGVCVDDPGTTSCMGDADCDGLERGVNGICGAGVSSIGDPCVDAEECNGGICRTAGTCTRGCDASALCPDNYERRGRVCTTGLGQEEG